MARRVAESGRRRRLSRQPHTNATRSRHRYFGRAHQERGGPNRRQPRAPGGKREGGGAGATASEPSGGHERHPGRMGGMDGDGPVPGGGKLAVHSVDLD